MKQQRLKNCATPMSLQGLGRSWISSYCRSTIHDLKVINRLEKARGKTKSHMGIRLGGGHIGCWPGLPQVVIDPMNPLAYKQEKEMKFRDTVVIIDRQLWLC